MKLHYMVMLFMVAVCCDFTTGDTVVWDGDNGVDLKWSTEGNWINGGAPVSATNLTLVFAGNANMGTPEVPLNQDISDPFKLNQLKTSDVASSDKSICINGLPLIFTADGGNQPLISQDRDSNLYIYNEVKIPENVIIDHAIRTYGMEYHGVITGAGCLRFMPNASQQGGELNLYNSGNTYSGGTVYINKRGTNASWSRLKVYASNVFGTGPVSISGGNLFAAGTTQAAGVTFYGSTAHTNDFLLQASSPIFAGVMDNKENPANASVALSGGFDLNSYTLYLRGHENSEGFLSGVISEGGADALKKLDLGVWTLSGANTFTGKVTITNGKLIVGAVDTIPPEVAIDIEGGVYDLNGLSVTNETLSISNGGIENGTLVADSISLSGGSISASIAGDSNLTKSGTDTTTLSASNSYSGATIITSGTLRFAQRSALYNGNTAEWTTDNISVSNGAAMRLNTGGIGEFIDTDVALLSDLGSISGGFQSGAVLALDTTNAINGVFSCKSVTIGNANGNNLSVTKIGPGTLVMGDDNSYIGTTRLEEGALSAAVLSDGGMASGIGAAAADRFKLVFAGGTLQYTGPSVALDKAFTINSNTNAVFEVTKADSKLSFLNLKESLIPENCTIIKNGAGTLEFGLDGPGGDHWSHKANIRTLIINDGVFANAAGDVPQINSETTLSSGPSLVFGDGAILDCSIPLSNGNGGTEQLVRYVGSNTTATIRDGLFSGPYADGEFNTKVFDINDGAAEIDLLSTASYSIYAGGGDSSKATSNIRKSGAGTLKLSGSESRFRGTTTIRDGRIIAGGNVPLGGNSVLGDTTSVVRLADSETATSNHVALVFDGPYTFSRDILVNPFGASATIGNISTRTATFDGAILLSNTVRLTSAATAANATVFNGIISGSGGITISGTGTVTLAAANTYTGTTTVTSGTLKLGASNRISDASSLRLEGGTFDTAGYNQKLNTLDVDGDAVIDFGNGSSEIRFAASDLETWNGSLLMRNRTQGQDRLFVGVDANGLTEDQLSRIISSSGQPSLQLVTGEVIPIPMGSLIILR